MSGGLGFATTCNGDTEAGGICSSFTKEVLGKKREVGDKNGGNYDMDILFFFVFLGDLVIFCLISVGL